LSSQLSICPFIAAAPRLRMLTAQTILSFHYITDTSAYLTFVFKGQKKGFLLTNCKQYICRPKLEGRMIPSPCRHGDSDAATTTGTYLSYNNDDGPIFQFHRSHVRHGSPYTKVQCIRSHPSHLRPVTSIARNLNPPCFPDISQACRLQEAAGVGPPESCVLRVAPPGLPGDIRRVGR
jgi:hypothetical protein